SVPSPSFHVNRSRPLRPAGTLGVSGGSPREQAAASTRAAIQRLTAARTCLAISLLYTADTVYGENRPNGGHASPGRAAGLRRATQPRLRLVSGLQPGCDDVRQH